MSSPSITPNSSQPMDIFSHFPNNLRIQVHAVEFMCQHIHLSFRHLSQSQCFMELETSTYSFCGIRANTFELEEGIADGFVVGEVCPEKMRHPSRGSSTREYFKRVRNFVYSVTLIFVTLESGQVRKVARPCARHLQNRHLSRNNYVGYD